MSKKPIVSVIIIFLDAEKFLREAIESVFAQTYENWELLLVDDGSTDTSSTIAKEFARKWPERVHYLEHDDHQNLGMSVSRNLGIDHAKGDYITFLDADDSWMTYKLEEQVAIMDSYPEADLVCGRALWWYSWTWIPEDIQRDFIQQLDVPPDTLVKSPELLILFLKNEWASLCDILVRREVVQASGGYEKSFKGIYEDQVFHSKICMKSVAFVSSRCWYRYRQHPNACTSQSHRSGQTYSARHTFLNWLEEYISYQKVKKDKLWRVVKRELWLYRYPILYRILNRTQHLKKVMKDLGEHLSHRIFPLFVQRWLQRAEKPK